MKIVAKKPVASSFQINDREAWALSMHMVNAVRPKDHAEQLRHFRACEEFGLADVIEMIVFSGLEIKVSQFDQNNVKVVTVSRDAVEYVLEKTNTEMAPLHSMVLTPLVERLNDLKAGRYSLPKDQEAAE